MSTKVNNKKFQQLENKHRKYIEKGNLWQKVLDKIEENYAIIGYIVGNINIKCTISLKIFRDKCIFSNILKTLKIESKL
jgi:hypothetical protein